MATRIRLAGSDAGQAEVGRILKELNVVVPSIWYEDSPNAIVEAFAHRTPVIVTNPGSMAKMVEYGRDGLLFESGNAGDLSRQISRLMTKASLLPTLLTGIQPVRTFSDEVRELEAVDADVIRSWGSSPRGSIFPRRRMAVHVRSLR
jgi:hypothetical protein